MSQIPSARWTLEISLETRPANRRLVLTPQAPPLLAGLPQLNAQHLEMLSCLPAAPVSAAAAWYNLLWLRSCQEVLVLNWFDWPSLPTFRETSPFWPNLPWQAAAESVFFFLAWVWSKNNEVELEGKMGCWIILNHGGGLCYFPRCHLAHCKPSIISLRRRRAAPPPPGSHYNWDKMGRLQLLPKVQP